MRRLGVLVVSAGVVLALGAESVAEGVRRARARRRPRVSQAVKHDTSAPLWLLAPPAETREARQRFERKPRPLPPLRGLRRPSGRDPVLQDYQPTPLIPAALANFEGVGQGFTGPQGTFVVNAAPPDTNGDVGPNHYVQTVNTDLAVLDKSGTVLYGPVAINTLWSGFGGNCQTDNDGDPIVLYDPIADRWLVSQFANVSSNTGPYYQCVAVSTGPDPTGSYNRYAFQYNDLNDYPKFGVWPDAYYVTFNMFHPPFFTFSGGLVCAYDRTKMLNGQAATQQCFLLPNDGGLLPADLDGATLPPAGAPNYILEFDTFSSLALFKFHVDWTTPANSTFTGPTGLSVASFSEACNGGACIPQLGTTNVLDSLADRLMYRLAYRNFGTHESLVTNHSVNPGNAVSGVRWYEIRLPGGVPTLQQQGTYSPDATARWMGSIAMDQSGNMALGFSASSTSVKPQIRYTGRLASDTLGLMPQGEASFIDGNGAQTAPLTRWGDYSMMAVDPVDDCTFWYTTEYIPADGSFNWRTRIASFKFPTCGQVVDDFSISANPDAVLVSPGNSTQVTISTAVTNGSAQTVDLSATGVPANVTVGFTPTSVTAGDSSTMTIDVGPGAANGVHPITVHGTGTDVSHTTSVQLTIAPPDFRLSIRPATTYVTQGNLGHFTIRTSVIQSPPQTVTLSVTGLPRGCVATFYPASLTSGESSVLRVETALSTPPGRYVLTITGAGTSATHSAKAWLVVRAR